MIGKGCYYKIGTVYNDKNQVEYKVIIGKNKYVIIPCEDYNITRI